MNKLHKKGISNVPPSPKITGFIVREDYNTLVEKINELIDYNKIGPMFRFVTSQTGTADPEITVLRNDLNLKYEYERELPGTYELIFLDLHIKGEGYTTFPENEPPLVIDDIGTITLTKLKNNTFALKTYDTDGELGDTILDQLIVTIEFYKI